MFQDCYLEATVGLFRRIEEWRIGWLDHNGELVSKFLIHICVQMRTSTIVNNVNEVLFSDLQGNQLIFYLSSNCTGNWYGFVASPAMMHGVGLEFGRG